MNRLTHTWKLSEHSCTWTISSVKLIQAGICAVWSVYPLVVWLNKPPFMEGFGNSCDYEERRCLISPVSESHSNTHTHSFSLNRCSMCARDDVNLVTKKHKLHVVPDATEGII